jgi:DNA-directed RNA polymerase subunit L
VGLKDPRWQPCVWRYRHNRDPRWANVPGYEKIQLRKKPAHMGLREQFYTMSPAECAEQGKASGTTYDHLFSIPYETQLMFEFNGKMDPKLAFIKAIDILKNALEDFYAQYKTAATTLDETLENSSIIYKEQHSSTTQTLYVPYNTNDTVPDKYMILIQHSMGNIIANKLLYLFDKHIAQNTADLYKNTLIAYKIPHQLISQSIFTIQLPLDDTVCIERFAKIGIEDDFHEKLIEKAINSLVDDLNAITKAL